MLWKVQFYRRGEMLSTKWGVIEAPSQDEAASMATSALAESSSDYVNVEPIHVEQLLGLPEGTLFVSYRHA
jgi:hypothetical protein